MAKYIAVRVLNNDGIPEKTLLNIDEVERFVLDEEKDKVVVWLKRVDPSDNLVYTETLDNTIAEIDSKLTEAKALSSGRD